MMRDIRDSQRNALKLTIEQLIELDGSMKLFFAQSISGFRANSRNLRCRTGTQFWAGHCL